MLNIYNNLIVNQILMDHFVKLLLVHMHPEKDLVFSILIINIYYNYHIIYLI